ncbi:MAG: hypothetical protein QMD25_00845 [Caldisericia bacterium]|nr:hypothetical protein [Caldisericia bacterium]
MEDRFKIKRKREFKLSKKILKTLNFIIFILIYIIILFSFSQKGVYLNQGIDVLPLSFKIGKIDNTLFYSTSKSIYLLNEDNFIPISYFIRNFKVDEDKIYVLSDNLIILNKEFKIIKEIKKEGFYPYDLYFFKDKFAVKYMKKDSLSIYFSLFDKKSYKEIRNIKFENLTSMPFSTVFSNGEKILIFQNDGDLLIVNFNGEIILQKNIRPKNEILFNPKGLIDNERENIVLYWQNYSYLTNSVLFLKYDGDIKIKFDIKSNIDEIIKINNKYYILLNNEIIEIENEKIIKKISIPFFKPVAIFNINNKFVSIWEVKLFNSEYKILKIEGKNFIFRGKFKDIFFDDDKFLVLIDSKIYILKYYE